MDQHQPIGDSFNIRRSIANGFVAIRVAAGPMWVAGLLMSISDGCTGSPSNDIGDLFDTYDDRSAWFALPGRLPMLSGASALSGPNGFDAVAIGLAFAAALAVLLFVLALFALNSFLQTGFIRLHEQILIDATEQFGPLFSGKDRFWHMAGCKVLSFLAVSGTFIATAWPGALIAYFGQAREQHGLWMVGVGVGLLLTVPATVYVFLGVYLSELAVALEGASPIIALRRSWSLADGNRLPLFAFALLCFLVNVASYAGVLLCCVGLLVTLPFGRSLTGFAKTEGFLLFTRGAGESVRWRLWQRDVAGDRAQPVAGWGVHQQQQPAELPATRQPDEPPPDWPPRDPKDRNG